MVGTDPNRVADTPCLLHCELACEDALRLRAHLPAAKGRVYVSLQLPIHAHLADYRFNPHFAWFQVRRDPPSAHRYRGAAHHLIARAVAQLLQT